MSDVRSIFRIGYSGVRARFRLLHVWMVEIKMPGAALKDKSTNG